MTANRKKDYYSASRIVCLSYDAVEILNAIGCEDKIVGIPSGAITAGAQKPLDIGGFANPKIELIIDLKPDMVIGYSEICIKPASQLINHNITTLVLQHTSLEETYKSITLLGRITGKDTQAAALVSTMKQEFLKSIRKTSRESKRPTVYFEEWNKPYVCGTRWVSEVIEIAGGLDVFSDRSKAKKYLERKVTANEITAAAPEIIVASWCGKPVDIESFKKRPGWETVPAVKNGRIHEIPGEIILHPGPGLVKGAQYIGKIIRQYAG